MELAGSSPTWEQAEWVIISKWVARVPGAGGTVWSLQIPKPIYKDRAGGRPCDQHPEGDKENKVATLMLLSEEAA